MSKLILFDYNDAYILVKIIPVANTAVPGAATNNEKRKKKNCAPFADCVSEVNNVQVDNANYLDVVMPINNLL